MTDTILIRLADKRLKDAERRRVLEISPKLYGRDTRHLRNPYHDNLASQVQSHLASFASQGSPLVGLECRSREFGSVILWREYRGLKPRRPYHVGRHDRAIS